MSFVSLNVGAHTPRKARGLALLVALLVTTAAPLVRAGDTLTEPTKVDKAITKELIGLIQEGHISGMSVDDRMSARCMKSFLKSLDPMKMYFLQSDIEEFNKHKLQLDDQLLKQDLSFGFDVIRRFQQRVREKLPIIEKQVDAEHDFSVEESLVVEPDLLRYPRDEAAVKERWRKRIKHDILVETADDIELDEVRKKLKKRYNSFAKRMDATDNDELLEMYLGALTTSFDPHSTYMSPHTLENFEISMRLELDGIGAVLRSIDGYTTIERIVKGGAADRDGRLQAKDQIVAVGQADDDELTDVVDWKLTDVVPLVRGKRGTIVRLLVIPHGGGERRVYEITRDKVELADASAQGEVFEVEQGEKKHKVGVIDLPSFYRDMKGAEAGKENVTSTTKDVRKILRQFKVQDVETVVLDLRSNGGGSLTEAIDLTGVFIKSGPVLQVRNYNNNVRSHRDNDDGTEWDGPLVVLVSRFSASASEIVAAAIQDYSRGIVVGDPMTHGKGTVQTLVDLGRRGGPNLGALKLTFQQFYRVNGASTQNRGVQSDIELPSLTAHYGVGEAELDHSVAFHRIDPAKYRSAKSITKNTVKSLRERSARRVAVSEDFKEVSDRIQRYLKYKDRDTVPLKRETYLAQRKELEIDLDDEDGSDSDTEDGAKKDTADVAGADDKTDDAAAEEPENKIERNYYLEEAMQIAIDLLKARRQVVVHP
ncbi:MAG: carboxy terminal-processing peptidase [Planctomycetota bacterium]